MVLILNITNIHIYAYFAQIQPGNQLQGIRGFETFSIISQMHNSPQTLNQLDRNNSRATMPCAAESTTRSVSYVCITDDITPCPSSNLSRNSSHSSNLSQFNANHLFFPMTIVKCEPPIMLDQAMDQRFRNVFHQLTNAQQSANA